MIMKNTHMKLVKEREEHNDRALPVAMLMHFHLRHNAARCIS
jgi:hypothetical protein